MVKRRIICAEREGKRYIYGSLGCFTGIVINMRLVVVIDTFLKLFPDPIGQFRKSNRPGQVILLKKGTNLEVTDYLLLKNEASREADEHMFIRLATPPRLTGHRNLRWFLKAAHVEIQPAGRQHTDDSNAAFNRTPGLTNPMDSFLGLVLTPPITVEGQYYPFGRIAYSSCSLSEPAGRSPDSMSELIQFLRTQKIQLPFGLHTDWLIVDRASEIVSFLPADNDKGFQVLVASPASAKVVLKCLADEGLADAVMFRGIKRADYNSRPGTYQKAEISVGSLLKDSNFWEANRLYQHYMDKNIQTLKKELGIKDCHLANVPVLFHPPLKSGRTAAYFPNMINHHLLEDGRLQVPRPKGPIVNGKCAFETAFERVVFSRTVFFTEDRDASSRQQGEVSLWA